MMQESGVELDEHDDFQSFDFGPRNVATIAEEEATARGLQVYNDLKFYESFVLTAFWFLYYNYSAPTDN